jgi:hypothetical protein
MSIRINPNSSAEDVKKALEALQSQQKGPEEKKLASHFGKLKRGLDGMKYQNEIRDEWT